LAGVSCTYRLAKDCFQQKRRRWIPFVLWFTIIATLAGVDIHLTERKKQSSEAKAEEIPNLNSQIKTLNGTIRAQSTELSNAQGHTDQHVSDIQEENKRLRASIDKKDAALVDIARQQFALNYAPQVAAIYDSTNDQLEVWNEGKTNIEIWGGKIGPEPTLVKDKPTIVPPTTFEGYYHFKENMLKDANASSTSENGLVTFDCSSFIRTLDHKRYVVSYKVRLTLKDGGVDKIDSFLDGIIETDWRNTKPQ
jgi:hypothetical protein